MLRIQEKAVFPSCTLVVFGKAPVSYSGSERNKENLSVLPWKNVLNSDQICLVPGVTGGAQGTDHQAFRNWFMAPREKAGRVLSAWSGGREAVAAAWIQGCSVPLVWSKTVIKFPLQSADRNQSCFRVIQVYLSQTPLSGGLKFPYLLAQCGDGGEAKRLGKKLNLQAGGVTRNASKAGSSAPDSVGSRAGSGLWEPLISQQIHRGKPSPSRAGTILTLLPLFTSACFPKIPCTEGPSASTTPACCGSTELHLFPLPT